MVSKYLLAALVGVLLFSLGVVGGCGGGLTHDQRSVKELIIEEANAFNNQDWHAFYEMQSPNFRLVVSYEEFSSYQQQEWDEAASTHGSVNTEVSDIKVRVEGEWGYATYELEVGPVEIDLAELGKEDVFRKVGDNWYDVAEDPDELGYDEEDLPPL